MKRKPCRYAGPEPFMVADPTNHDLAHADRVGPGFRRTGQWALQPARSATMHMTCSRPPRPGQMATRCVARFSRCSRHFPDRLRAQPPGQHGCIDHPDRGRSVARSIDRACTGRELLRNQYPPESLEAPAHTDRVIPFVPRPRSATSKTARVTVSFVSSRPPSAPAPVGAGRRAPAAHAGSPRARDRGVAERQ